MTQKLKIYIVMLVTFTCGLLQVFSQEQTTYQKKLIEIKKSFIKESLVAGDRWSEKLETELNNFSEKEINELLPKIKLGLAGIPKESAVTIINKFASDVLNAKKLKSKDAAKREFDDMREQKINLYVEELKEIKELILDMGTE